MSRGVWFHFSRQQGRVATLQRAAVDADGAAHHVHVGLALGVELELGALGAVEQSSIQRGVGVDVHRAIGAAVAGH